MKILTGKNLVKFDEIFENFKETSAYIPANQYKNIQYTRGWIAVCTLTIDGGIHDIAAMYHFSGDDCDMIIISPELAIVNAILTVPENGFTAGYDESYPWDIVHDAFEPVPMTEVKKYLHEKYGVNVFGTFVENNWLKVFEKYGEDYDMPCVCRINENGEIDKVIYHPSSSMCDLIGISF